MSYIFVILEEKGFLWAEPIFMNFGSLHFDLPVDFYVILSKGISREFVYVLV